MTEQRPQTPERPNIVLILVDDMGYSDIGCYGSEIRTPNLNRLAAGGVRFTQMYNCARCCPTRASLLTGLGPHQAGVGHMVNDHGVGPAYQGYLRDDAVTIAEALKAGGYRTLMSGKWHCGGYYDALTPEVWRPGTEGFPTPITRGFDEFYGTVAGAGNYFSPHALMRQDKFIQPEGDYYYTDAISEEAAAMIGRAATGDQPFFLHVTYTAPHWPLHAREEDIAEYEGKYREGWDAVRTARHEQLKGMGVLDPKWDITPRDDQAPPWADVDAKRRDWEDLRMAVYAAQIDSMDRGVGVIVDRLRELDVLDNTLVMFLSDNGGCAEFLAEDGWCVRYNMTAPGGKEVKIGNVQDLRPGPAETYMSYDLPWSNASNSPFRLYKHWVHEGGIATPLICHWGDTVAPGRFAHQPLHVMDLMATCLDVAGVEYPEHNEGRPIQPLEGESFAPVLRGEEKWTRRREIVWEHEGNCAVRQNNWKLVRKHPGQWELYDMNVDRTELNDLAEKNTPKVGELSAIYTHWAARCGVLPWPPKDW